MKNEWNSPHMYFISSPVRSRYTSQICLTRTAHSSVISRSISTFTFQSDSKFNFSIIFNALEKEPTVICVHHEVKIDLTSENNVIHVHANSAEEILFTCRISID